MQHELAASDKLAYCNVHRDSERVKELELYLFCVFYVSS